MADAESVFISFALRVDAETDQDAMDLVSYGSFENECGFFFRMVDIQSDATIIRALLPSTDGTFSRKNTEVIPTRMLGNWVHIGLDLNKNDDGGMRFSAYLNGEMIPGPRGRTNMTSATCQVHIATA